MDETAVTQVDADVGQPALILKEHEIAFARRFERYLLRGLEEVDRVARHRQPRARIRVEDEAAAVEALLRARAAVAIRHADHLRRDPCDRAARRVRRAIAPRRRGSVARLHCLRRRFERACAGAAAESEEERDHRRSPYEAKEPGHRAPSLRGDRERRLNAVAAVGRATSRATAAA